MRKIVKTLIIGLFAMFCFFSCVPPVETYIIQGEVEWTAAGVNAYIAVWDGFMPAEDAVVTLQLNGGTPTQATYMGFWYTLSGSISGGTPEVGDEITMNVSVGSASVSETLTVPVKPNVTAPLADSSHDAANPLQVVWDPLNPAPSELQISIWNFFTASEEDYEQSVSGTATSHTIPGGVLKADMSNITVDFVSLNTRTLSGGNYAAGSYYTVYNESSSAYFATNP